MGIFQFKDANSNMNPSHQALIGQTLLLPDIVNIVLSFLEPDFQTLLACTHVDKIWHKCTRNQSLWRRIALMMLPNDEYCHQYRLAIESRSVPVLREWRLVLVSKYFKLVQKDYCDKFHTYFIFSGSPKDARAEMKFLSTHEKKLATLFKFPETVSFKKRDSILNTKRSMELEESKLYIFYTEREPLDISLFEELALLQREL
jgi:hypothetical protein